MVQTNVCIRYEQTHLTMIMWFLQTILSAKKGGQLSSASHYDHVTFMDNFVLINNMDNFRLHFTMITYFCRQFYLPKFVDNFCPHLTIIMWLSRTILSSFCLCTDKACPTKQCGQFSSAFYYDYILLRTKHVQLKYVDNFRPHFTMIIYFCRQSMFN
jgi:hypothetical protein